MPNVAAKAPRQATLLTWFPHSPTEWRRVTRGLTFAQRGALEFARDEAWDDLIPCTLADDDEAWKLLLGPEWAALLPVLRRFFLRDPEHPGRVRWPWLWEKWQQQAGRYAQKVSAGRQGGTAPGAKRGRKPTARPDAANRTGNSEPNGTPNSALNSTPNSTENSAAIPVLLQIERGGFTPDADASGGESPPRVAAPLAGAGGPGASPRGERDAPGDGPGARAAASAVPPADPEIEPPPEARPSLTALFAAEAGEPPPPRAAVHPPPEEPPERVAARAVAKRRWAGVGRSAASTAAPSGGPPLALVEPPGGAPVVGADAPGAVPLEGPPQGADTS